MSPRATATVDQLFLDEICRALDAERRFLGARAAMLDRATAPGLRAMLRDRIAEGPGHVGALKEALAALGARPRRIKSDGAEGLVAEAERVTAGSGASPTVADCAIASALAKAEHYEVATYRGLVAAAKEMERDDLVEILLGNLEQEEEAATRAEAAVPDLLRRAMSEVVEG